MNLNELNLAQCRSLISLAHKISMVDGKVVPSEVILINHLKAEIGGEILPIAEEIFGPSNYEVFDTAESRTTVLQWLYMIALSDAHFHVDESAVVQEVAEAFKFSLRDTNTIREIAEDRILRSSYEH